MESILSGSPRNTISSRQTSTVVHAAEPSGAVPLTDVVGAGVASPASTDPAGESQSPSVAANETANKSTLSTMERIYTAGL